MGLANRLLLLVAIALPLAADDSKLAGEELAIIKVVLDRAVLPQMVTNWGLTGEEVIVVSDRTIECVLPFSEAELQRVAALSARQARGEALDDDLHMRQPERNQELVTPDHIVMRDLVEKCGNARRGKQLPEDISELPLNVKVESDDIVEREFRVDPHAWRRRHPSSAGVVHLSTPAIADDHARAVMSFNRMRNGIGGGTFFCLLEKRGGEWIIAWQETVLIE